MPFRYPILSTELSLTQPTVLPRLDDLAPLLQTILIPDRQHIFRFLHALPSHSKTYTQSLLTAYHFLTLTQPWKCGWLLSTYEEKV